MVHAKDSQGCRSGQLERIKVNSAVATKLDESERQDKDQVMLMTPQVDSFAVCPESKRIADKESEQLNANRVKAQLMRIFRPFGDVYKPESLCSGALMARSAIGRDNDEADC
jgi:hypothetical protein